MKSSNVKMRTRTGSWSAFEKRYQPIADSDNSLCRDWRDSEIQNAPESLVWTILDCDGKLIVSPGFATVNFVGRILCAIPWNETEFNNSGYLY